MLWKTVNFILPDDLTLGVARIIDFNLADYKSMLMFYSHENNKAQLSASHFPD